MTFNWGANIFYQSKKKFKVAKLAPLYSERLFTVDKSLSPTPKPLSQALASCPAFELFPNSMSCFYLSFFLLLLNCSFIVAKKSIFLFIINN